MDLRLFSIVFGDRYLDWFERACVLSLSWPINREALKRAKVWDIWTTTSSAERAESIAAKLGIPVAIHADIEDSKDSLNLSKALHAEIELCANESGAMLWVAPDSIFGDGTIRTFLETATVPGICVAHGPMRVNQGGFLEAMGPGPVSNARLVKLAFERMHAGFRAADVSLPQTNSYKSGLSWRKIGDKLYAVTHLLPSSYLLQPNRRDLKWMLSKPKFGNYDHSFPSVLVDQQRQRVIGSSDAAFVAELTMETVDKAPLSTVIPEWPDKFWQDLPHHGVNRNVVVIWRAE